jgi:hypothetical protein
MPCRPADVRPMFASTFGVVASTFGLAERNPSGTTNGHGGSSGNGGTSSPPAAALDTAEGAPLDRQVPTGKPGGWGGRAGGWVGGLGHGTGQVVSGVGVGGVGGDYKTPNPQPHP